MDSYKNLFQILKSLDTRNSNQSELFRRQNAGRVPVASISLRGSIRNATKIFGSIETSADNPIFAGPASRAHLYPHLSGEFCIRCQLNGNGVMQLFGSHRVQLSPHPASADVRSGNWKEHNPANSPIRLHAGGPQVWKLASVHVSKPGSTGTSPVGALAPIVARK